MQSINSIVDFCPHLGSFCYFSHNDLSEVVVNHLKTARGEIWLKRSEKNHKNLPR